ncbi:MAG TPA: pitrilysin family protein [Terriglobia bacterium]|nr:pitrilysin family protein [Terriglobia bacterium]
MKTCTSTPVSSAAGGPSRVEFRGRRSLLPSFVLALALATALGLAPRLNAAGRPQTDTGGTVLRATLPNGLRVVIVPNRLAPVVTTMVNYLVGSNESPEGFPGTAHAMEHMMFRGSPGLSADQLAEVAAAMGGAFNADTQQSVTQYFYTIPAEDLDVALRIEANRMRAVDADPKEWEKERGAIEQEVARDYSNPVFVFYTKLLAAMYKGTPLADPGLGTRPTFDKTTAEMLKKFHDDWYSPNNAILIVVGDVDPQAALAQVKTFFGDIPSKTLPARQEIHLSAVESQTMNLDTDLPYGLALISFRMPGTSSPDYAAAQVLGDVLSSQRGTLYGLVPEGKALFAGFQIQSLPQAGLGFALSAYPKGADANALSGEMRKILEEDLKNGLPADLVAAAKLHELAGAEFQKNSVEGLASAWSAAVAVEGRQSPDDDVKAMQQVTVDDVNRVARQYLALPNSITAILTPQPSGKPTSRSTFGGQESFTPKEAKLVPLPDWAQQALHRLAVPTATTHPTETTLENGIKLIVQPEDVSDTVTVFGRIKSDAGLETPKGQDGVDDILGQLFSYGTTTLDRVAFQKALDDIGADENAGLEFSVQALASHLDRALELLADNELHPALPQQAFQITQPQMASYAAGELQSPDHLAGHALHANLFPKDDPTLREATPETISSLKLDDVKSFYNRAFRPDLTTIVVMGKVTPEEAKAAVEKYFGAWRATGPPPPTDLPAVPENQALETEVPDSSRVQDGVTLAETVGITRFSPDYYALELGNQILGGSFYASRFSKDLRESAGLVYTVGSSLQAGKTRSIYSVNYGCDPPNVSKARAIIVRDLKAMQSSPPDPDELQEAKALVLRGIPLRESSFASIAGGWIARSAIGLPLDEPFRAAQRYLDLTGAQIQAAFARWLRPNGLVQVTQGPKPQ